MAVVEGDPFGPVNRCPVQPKGSGAVFASPEMGDHQGSVSMIPREGLNNPHLGRNAIGCGSKIRFEDLSER